MHTADGVFAGFLQYRSIPRLLGAEVIERRSSYG
jgi:hypothetical protein